MKNLGEIKDGKDVATKEYVDKKVINPNWLKDTDFSIEFDKNTDAYVIKEIPLPGDLSQYINKQITMSFYVSDPGEGVNLESPYAQYEWSKNRFGAQTLIKWENTTTGETIIEYPTILLRPSATGARMAITGKITQPDGYDKIQRAELVIHLFKKPASDNDATWVFARPKLELSDTATDWCPHVDDFTAKADKTYVDTQDNTIKADVAKIKTAMEDKADKASIIDTINNSAETAVISADKVEVTSCCATGSFINDSTAVNRCDTGFGVKPKIFKLYYIANGEPQLAAELHPDLDADLQKFIYDDLPITTFAAGTTGIVGIRFSTATGMTFVWEAYK